jgi:hypothetical protein
MYTVRSAQVCIDTGVSKCRLVNGITKYDVNTAGNVGRMSDDADVRNLTDEQHADDKPLFRSE